MVVRASKGSGSGASELGVAAIVLCLVLAGTWLAPVWPESAVALQVSFGVLGCALIAARSRKRRVGWKELGLRLDNLPSSLVVFALATFLLCAPAMLAGGADLTSPFSPAELPSYFAWASFQQFVAVGGFWLPLRRVAGASPDIASGWVRESALALGAASVFALAHAPNPGLMALVGFAESAWLFLFARFRNLAALSLAHAAAALVVSHHLVPSRWLSSMTVGLAYWQ